MGVSTTSSLGISLICSILVFSGLQMYRGALTSTKLATLIAGYTASWLFVFLLTQISNRSDHYRKHRRVWEVISAVLNAINNLETIMFGKGFQAKLIPEVVISLLLACFAAAMVHRVSVTVCFLCSIMALYYINKQSQITYSTPGTNITYTKKKRA